MPQKSDFPSKEPRKKKSAVSAYSGGGRVEWKGYINIPLVEADKRHFQQWKAQPDIVNEAFHTTLADGYKLSVDYQGREDAFRASLYCQNVDFPEAGYCLSIYAGDYWEALIRVLYVHSVKCQGSWERYIGRRSVVEDWDV